MLYALFCTTEANVIQNLNNLFYQGGEKLYSRGTEFDNWRNNVFFRSKNYNIIRVIELKLNEINFNNTKMCPNNNVLWLLFTTEL